MATQVIYKSGAKWVVNQYILDAGSCLAVESADGLHVKLSLKTNLNNLSTVALGNYTEYVNAAGTPYGKTALLALFDDFLVGSDGDAEAGTIAANPSGLPKKAIVELTRPADILAYNAGDNIGTATVAVKQKETLTLSGALAAKQKHIVTLSAGAPVKQKQTFSFGGTAPTKQKETVTLSGSSGTLNVTLTGNLTKLATYHTNPTTTASDFVTAHEVAYLAAGIVVTSSGADLIFESELIGLDFVPPAIVGLTGNLAGEVVHTVGAVKISKVNIANSIFGSEIAIDDAIATALGTFVTNNATSYLGFGIVLTSSDADLILESETAGIGFEEFYPVTTEGNVYALSATTQVNVPAGGGQLGLLSTLLKPVVFDTDLGTTAAAFASAHAAAFDALGIAVTASTVTIIFEAKVAGVAFEKPIFRNTAGTLAGAVADTVANRATGTATISAGGVPKTSTFVTNATTTAAAFVTANAADYLAAGIVVTSSSADLIFEANVAGVAFAIPVFTNLTGTYAGALVSTTPNTTLIPLTFADMALTNTGGGFLSVVKVESNITALAAVTLRLWFFNEVPTGIVGDNVAYTNLYANSSKRCFYVDVVMDALLVNSDSVYGKTEPVSEYVTVDKNLYCLVQTLTGFTPTSAGKIKISVSSLILA